MKLKKIKSIIKLYSAWIVLNIFKRELLKKEIWLISEKKTDARDNGHHFFKYMRKNHPEINAYYAITKDSADLYKIEEYGNIVWHGSFTHYIYWLAAKNVIGSQPDRAMPSGLPTRFRNFGKKRNGIYIRHGICKDRLPQVDYAKTGFDMITCSSSLERDFVCKTNKYPQEVAKLLGLCRYDNLYGKEDRVKKQILIMPTFRGWLLSGNITQYATENEVAKFKQSDYFRAYQGILKNEKLQNLLKEYGYTVIFYPHYATQPYIKSFTELENENTILADRREYDVQELLIESEIMITDYSSVFFDFAYMKKPLIYFQFDKEQFEKGHYEKGYFDYDEDGFGAVTKTVDETVSELEKIIKNESKVNESYAERIDRFFDIRDNKNCERTYNAIMELK